MDRLQAIEIFVRVVDLGSFSKAAADMGVGQPTATKLVAALEKRVGARLLHRSTHGVTPTEIGAQFYEKCKLIVHHIDDAQTVTTLLQSQVQGTLRITCSVAFGRRVLSPLVMRFMQLHPTLQVELNLEDRYTNLVEQGIDVAIRMGPLADSTLGARYLGINPWVLVGSSRYLENQGVPQQPTDLAAHRALVYSTVQGDARWHFTGPAGRVQTVAVTGPLRSNNLSALLVAARSGMGLAALPSYVANASVLSSDLTMVLSDWSLPAQEIHAVYPSPQLVPAKVTRFVSWLQGQFGPTWWAD